MSACAMLSYNNVTPAAWQCGVAKAAGYGITISSNSGSVTEKGFTVKWNYNPAAQTCTLQCTDSPWIVPCSLINGTINDAVESCLSQNNLAVSEMVDA
jgi:hypothetical protein